MFQPVAFRTGKVKPAIIMIHTVLVLRGTVRKIEGKQKEY